MEGARSATINLTYNVLGDAARTIKAMRADLERMTELAQQGINIRASAAAAAHDPIGASPTRPLHRQAPGGFGGGGLSLDMAAQQFQYQQHQRANAEAERNARQVWLAQKQAQRQIEQSNIRTAAYYAGVRRREQQQINAQKKDDLGAYREMMATHREQENAIRNRDRVSNSLLSQRRREEARAAKPGERMTEQFRRQRIKREVAKMDEFLGFNRKSRDGRRSGSGRGTGRGYHGGGRSGIATRALLNPGGAAGIQGLMGMGTAGMALGIPLLANYIVKEMAQNATGIANIAQRGDLTSAQRRQGVSEALPIIGGTIRALRELSEALNGTTERIRVIGIRAELQETRNQAAARFDPMLLAARVQQAAAASQAASMQGARPVPVERFDRSTISGERAFTEDQLRLPHRIAIAEAERGVTAARGAQAASSERLREMRLRQRGLNEREFDAQLDHARINREERPRRRTPQELQEAARRHGAFGGAAAFDPMVTPPVQHEARARNQAQRRDINQQQANVGGLINQELQTQLQLTTQVAQAESTLRQRNIALMREELTILQNRERVMVNSAHTIGMMNPIDRMVGMTAAREYMRLGHDQSPQFLRERAATVIPDIVEHRAIQSGQRSGEFQEIQRWRGLAGVTLEGNREAQRVNQAETQVAVLADTTRLSNDLTAANNNHMRALEIALRELTRVTVERTRIDQQGRTNNNVGANQGAAGRGA